NFANDFFKKILERDYSFERSVLIGDDCKVKSAFLHASQSCVEAHRIRDKVHRMHYLLNAERFAIMPESENFFAVDHANDVVCVFVINGQPRESAFVPPPQLFTERREHS